MVYRLSPITVLIRYRMMAPVLLFAVWLGAFGFLQPAHSQDLHPLYTFGAAFGDGVSTYAPLVQASDGYFYGTTYLGGSYANPFYVLSGGGTVFKIDSSGNQTILHSFSSLNSSGVNWDGANPITGLVQGSDGALYGTTTYGGAAGNGTVFRITTSGSFITLHSFATGDGYYATSLIRGNNGALYGTTLTGGYYGVGGTVYKIDSSGTFSVLHSFSSSDSNGYNPNCVIQGSDGNLYGTADIGGAHGVGTVFKIDSAGNLSVLHAFDYYNDGSGPNGLIQGSDGALYGTAENGGYNGGNSAGSGTVFKITTSGTFSLLYTFSSNTYGNEDGANPSGLLQARDGNLYVTTHKGGGEVGGGYGVIFVITASGTKSPIHTFQWRFGVDVYIDGVNPNPLIQGSDGNLYGTTVAGGILSQGGNLSNTGWGTVYRFSLETPRFFPGWGIYFDLLLQNSGSGQLAVWDNTYQYDSLTGSNQVYTGAAFLYPSQNSAWKAVGVADFNADWYADILFQNQATGQLALWYMNKNYQEGAAFVYPSQDPHWQVIGVADFDGDGKPDILFQNGSTGQLAVWYMNNNYQKGAAFVYPSQDPAWKAVGVGDFNGDGHPDIVFQNPSTGQLAVWYMNNNYLIRGAFIIPSQQATLRCVAVGDLDGDGWPDLIFQNTNSGQLSYWLMSGVYAVDSSSFPTQPPAGWQVVGPH